MNELRSTFRELLAGYPDERETIQAGVDLAELDLAAYLAETTPEVRIRIGELAHSNGIAPARPRTMKAGQRVLAERMVEIYLSPPDTAFADAVMAGYDRGEAS